MRELLLQQLQTYAQNINKLEMDLIELEKVAKEKKTAMEQNTGAYNAILAIAIEQNIITPDGKLVEESEDEVEVINPEELTVDIEE